MGNLLDLALYNPTQLKDDDFLRGFVARQDLVTKILSRLGEITPKNLAQHRLIVGQRGMGKTSLLRRIAIGVRDTPALAEVLLPLRFREEQYNVHNLHVFWCNCLDALGDWFEDSGQSTMADQLDREVAALTTSADDSEGSGALAVFKEWLKHEGKRPLLMLDNIDLIFNGLKDKQWSLRRTLQEAGGIVVIGASAGFLEATSAPDAPFYDFFQVDVLEKLGRDELLASLRQLAEARGETGRKVTALLAHDPGRIHTLYDLTGGNPRTLVMLYLMLEASDEGDLMRDLERLLDKATPLYKARVEDLSSQARVVFDAVALAWNPVTAADTATVSGLETATVSTQLDRLTKDGVLEKVGLSTTSRTGFQVSERFFNIWYLMRHASRRQRSRLRWLTEFLRKFYSPRELREMAGVLIRPGIDCLTRSTYCLALSDAVDDKNVQNTLRYQARIELERHAAETGIPLENLADPAELYAPQNALEWFIQGKTLHVMLGANERAESAYRKAIELDPKFAAPWNGLGNLLHEQLGRYEEAEIAYHHAIELDSKFAYTWCNLGNLLKDKLGRYDEAEAAYRHAIELDPKDAPTWNNLGSLLQNNLGQYEAAEAAYRQAIAIEPKFAFPWNNLGNLMLYNLSRYEEAEADYRQAIELDHKFIFPWLGLGTLLQNHLGRSDEAEAAYRQAIELDQKNAFSWLCLSRLLKNLGRYEEAEAACRQSIELDPKNDLVWCLLGDLLRDNFGRYEEAETAYRQAIEINPKNAFPLCLLGYLLLGKLGRYEEAETAFRQANELDPKNVLAWSLLGYLLQVNMGRYDEAEVAYRRAVELNPKDDSSWANLGTLLYDHQGRYEEAEAAYRRSVELDQNDIYTLANIAYLLLAQPDRIDEAEICYSKIIDKLPAHAVSLLMTFHAFARDNFGEAVELLRAVLDEGCQEIYSNYHNELLRILRLAAHRGYGDKLLTWFNESGFGDQYWPLYAAFDAYLHGKERLGDVNPEVRGAASRIYDWLVSFTPAVGTGAPAINKQKNRKK